ncbi:MAG TPA: NADH-quinone oxidoreductase subunit M [Candidatus Saccharimonadales bacterium]|nr:NADH-quinone oxidoreductase subunit M [Candidatus Saccharimonadales bacterium]
MNVSDVPILSIITFLPLIGAVLVAILPATAARPVALGVALVTWVVSLLLLIGYLPGREGAQFQYVEVADWIPIFGIQYKLGVDGLSAALVVLTTTLTWICILASWKPIQTRIKEYMVAFLVLEVGLIGVFLALDLFLFYIFWEIVLVPMYLIIGIWGGANRIYATIKFVLYTLVGSLLMLVAILATGFAYQAAHGGSWVGAFDFENLVAFAASPAGGFAPALQIGAFLAFFLAFAIKVPMFPFHTWLPDAHTEAPTAGSVILAGVMLKLGAYGLMRFALPLFPDAAQTFAPAIIVLSLIAIIYGAIVALVQPDLKRLVAYSSVSHMGFVTLGLFVFTEQGVQGAVLQMINHGLITGALFLLVGVIYERTHDRTIAKMGGLAGRTPVYAALFGFFVFASAGLPGLSGFVGEFLTLVGTFEVSPPAAAIATFVMILAAGYLLYMYGRIVFGELSDFLAGLGDHLTDIQPIEILTLVPLATLVVVFGIQPGLLLDLIDGSVDATLAAAASGIAFEVSGTLVVAGIVLVVAGVAARILWVLARHGDAGSAPRGAGTAPAAEGGGAH